MARAVARAKGGSNMSCTQDTTPAAPSTSPSASLLPGTSDLVVKIGRSLWVFADPDMARLAAVYREPERFGGRCIFYGYPTHPPRMPRRRSRRYRLRWPHRTLGWVISAAFLVAAAVTRDGGLAAFGALAALAVVVDYVTERRG